MNKLFASLCITAAFTAATLTAQAQGWKNSVNDALNGGNKSSNSSSTTTKNNGSADASVGTTPINISGLTNGDASSALKEALTIGARNAASKLNVTNGFFGNSLIKILMPPESKQVESTLRKFGLGSEVDKAILSMNRAAEDAAGKAAPIFINAITSMSIQDGLSILTGGNGAGTAYLKAKTTAALTAAFRPVIEGSLDKTGATKYWKSIFTAYNKLPLIKHDNVNPDLAAYVTERALNGMFVSVAAEEAKIRTQPAAQVSDILQKVFGGKR